jgi:hypothetical protein
VADKAGAVSQLQRFQQHRWASFLSACQ